MFVAWHTAALGRVDKMPALSSLLGGERVNAPIKPQAWQDQLASVAAWVATIPD